MALDSQGIGSGMPPAAVNALTGTSASNLTATGTNVGTAFQMQAAYNEFTNVPSGAGAVMPQTQNTTPGDEVAVYNGGANALTIYPFGTETFNAGATSFSLASGKAVLIWKRNATQWATNLSA